MDRTALITGGTGGLGTAVVERFLGDGWRVVVPWLREKELGRLPPRDGLELVDAGGGAIVCVSTRAALRPFSGAAGYVGSKRAVIAFVESLAVEYRDDAVRANTILPSVIDTPGNRASQPDADHSKWVAPSEIASAHTFLSTAQGERTSSRTRTMSLVFMLPGFSVFSK